MLLSVKPDSLALRLTHEIETVKALSSQPSVKDTLGTDEEDKN